VWQVAAVRRMFASLHTVATDSTLCVHKLELWEFCSMEQFSWKASRSVYRQTDRQTVGRLAWLFIALTVTRTDSRLWSEPGQ
jgi:hypothetical protein